MPGGDDVQAQRRFIAFCAAMTAAVKKHGDLLRLAVASASNDVIDFVQKKFSDFSTLCTRNVWAVTKRHRRFSRFIWASDWSSTCEQWPTAAHWKALWKRNGNIDVHVAVRALIGIVFRTIKVADSVQPIAAMEEDRNRTAPIPWCGNRFELRAVGSSQHVAVRNHSFVCKTRVLTLVCQWSMTVLNTVVANELSIMSALIESGKSVDDVVRQTIGENQGFFLARKTPKFIASVCSIGALFSGNGYDSELIEKWAVDNDLFRAKDTPTAWKALTAEKVLFETVSIVNG